MLDLASDFGHGLDVGLGVRAVVVSGSVARGDFNRYSDVDVLVVAAHLPDGYRELLDAAGWPPPAHVEPVVWTPEEYVTQRRRGNPIAVEAEDAGVWLVGNVSSAAATAQD